MKTKDYAPTCGSCGATATKMTRAGLPRCQACYDQIGICRLPRGCEDIVVREELPGVPREQATVIRPDFSVAGMMAKDFRARRAGDDAA